MNNPFARSSWTEGALSLLVFGLLPLAADGQAPLIVMQSPGDSVVSGQCASFSVGASGTPAPGYQWQQSPDGGSTWVNLVGGNGMSGTDAPTLVIGAAAALMSGSQFRAVATNAAGSVTSVPVTLTVEPLPAGSVIAYDFSTLAGMAPGSADGTGASARFLNPGAVAADASGNLYVADSGNSTIRRITPQGVVTTFAGSPGSTGSSDGPGSLARFSGPQGIAVDGAGDVYVADTGNNAIREITPQGVVTTFMRGIVSLNAPHAVAVDGAGNVYVAETSVIRKMTPAGDVWLLAGDDAGWADGSGASAHFNQPRGIAVDRAGNVYVADTGNNTIRRISASAAVATSVVTTIAGKAPSFIQDAGVGMSDIQYYPGSTDGAGSSARFNGPQGVAVDGAGNLYVADTGNNTIRRITPAGMVTTFAGSPPAPATLMEGSSLKLFNPAASVGSADGAGMAARFVAPLGVAVDGAGTVYVADTGNDTIRSITPSGAVATLAGTAIQGADDGTGGAAQFFRPVGVAMDVARNLYVADAYNHVIRKVTPAGIVTTLAGSPGRAGSADGTGSAALFNYPEGVAVDGAGNVFVADTHNDTVRKITPAGQVTTLAGSPGVAGSADGTGGAAQFFYPFSLAVDGAGNIYVGDDDEVRKITPAGVVTTLAGSPPVPGGSDTLPQFDEVNGIAADGSGNVYVASNFAIQKVTPAGVVTTLAGNAHANQGGSADGAGPSASFAGAEALAIDGAGNLYVTDLGNNAIRRVTPAGEVTTLAAGLSQRFSGELETSPDRLVPGLGIAVDGSGALYITEDTYDVEYDTGGASPSAMTGVFSDRILVGTPRIVEPPAITTQPQSQTLTAGGTLTLTSGATGSPAPTYQWQFDGMPIPGATGPSLTTSNAGTTQSGTYSVVVTSGLFSTVSGAATVKVNSGGWLANLSARGFVEPVVDWAYPVVSGFVTAGPGPKSVLVRAVGPGLGQFGLAGFLPDPSLTINAGSAQGPALTSWEPGLAGMFESLGAFPLPAGSRDAAVLEAVGPGACTATINSSSQPAHGGVVLAEVYDADRSAPANRLVNLSARAFVGTGGDVLIGGFVVGGPSSETVLVRGVGPGLSQYNLAGLAEPVLAVYDSNPENDPQGPQVIARIQGWGGSPSQGASKVAARIEQATAAEMSLAGAFSLAAGSADCAMVLTLPPGAYTAEVSGADGATGVALVEIYELP